MSATAVEAVAAAVLAAKEWKSPVESGLFSLL